MTEAEADALNICSKITEAAKVPMATEMREVVLGGDSVIAFSVAEMAKENSKKEANKMTQAEADALKMLSKTT